MPLERGTRLGPYQIESPIGAGGMGEVYKATDTRLKRTVAIKVLPAHVASDPGGDSNCATLTNSFSQGGVANDPGS